MNPRQLFFKHLAQTSPEPLALELQSAKGIYLFDQKGHPYVDLISGFSVMNLGHGNEQVLAAIEKQIRQHMHLMVYGEIVQASQVNYAAELCKALPAGLDAVYFTNSGAEAVEGAMKLAKRVTGRTQIAAFKNAYHGSTQGALSILGDEYWRNAFRPLLPDILHLEFNDFDSLNVINTHTACVVVEVVQAEAGAIAAQRAWLTELRTRCSQVGALLVFDEIQTGFGRTGSLWAFEQYDLVPDVLLLGKALGGGMPLGAFIASSQAMQTLTNNPVLGHITTFGGHPVSCAAGLASFLELKLHLQEGLLNTVLDKEIWVRKTLLHPSILNIRGRGLLLAVEFESAEFCKKVCHACVKAGIITDWFLCAPQCMRIAPPLIITHQQWLGVAEKILNILQNIPVESEGHTNG